MKESPRSLSVCLFVILALLTSASTHAQNGTRLMPPYAADTGIPFWGASTAINALYIATGDPAFDGGKGAVVVFDVKTGATVRTFEGSLSSGAFGASVALRGSELIVGSPNAFGGSGLVSFLDIPSGRVLGTIDPPLLLLTPSLSGAFGASIACDGELIAVGSPEAANEGDTRGLACAIRRPIGCRGNGGNIHLLVPSDPQDKANFGRSVAIYGNAIAIGAPAFDNPAFLDSGKTYLFKDIPIGSGGTYNENVTDISGATAIGASYGWAIALTGSHLIASSPFVSGSTGAVWFFNHLYPSRPAEVELGTAPAEQFGYSLAASSTHIAISSPAANPSGSVPLTGKVTLFQEPTDFVPFILPQNGTLERPYLISNSVTGQSVAIFGNQIAAGSPGTGDIVTASFSLSSADSSHLIKIEATTGESTPSSQSLPITSFSQATVSGLAPYQSRCLAAANTTYLPTPRSRPQRAQAFLMPYLGLLTSVLPGSLPPIPTSLVGNTGTHFAYSPIANQFRVFPANNTIESVVFERFRPLALVELKAFNSPRHGQSTLGGSELFAAPCTFQTKTGGPIVNAANDSGITVFSPTGIERLTIQEATTNFPPTASLLGQLPGRAAYEFRNVVFPATLLASPTTSDSIIASYDTDTSTYALIAQEGQPAPGTIPATAAFSAFLGETSDGFGSNNATLFRATLRGPGVTSANNEGLWVLDTTLDPQPILIAQKGIPVAALKGSPKITRFLRYGIDQNSAIIVLAALSGSGVNSTNNLALIEFRFPSLTAVYLLRKGTDAPGTNGALIKDIPFVDGRRSGHWTALTTLTRGTGRADTTNDLALYTHQTSGISGPVLALRKGTQFARPGNEFIKSIRLSASVHDGRSGTLAVGLSHVVEMDRSVSAILTFADGVQSLATISP